MQSVVDSPLLAQTCPVPVPYYGRNIYEVALEFGGNRKFVSPPRLLYNGTMQFQQRKKLVKLPSPTVVKG